MNKAFKRYKKTAFKNTRYYRLHISRLMKFISARQAVRIGAFQLEQIKCQPAADKLSRLWKALAITRVMISTAQALSNIYGVKADTNDQCKV